MDFKLTKEQSDIRRAAEAFADGEFEPDTISELERTGIPLGIEIDAKLEERKIKLQSGDFVLFYTDGVTEAMNSDLELFGKQKLEDLIQANRESRIDTIQLKIQESVAQFIGDHAPSDDITLMIVKRT